MSFAKAEEEHISRNEFCVALRIETARSRYRTVIFTTVLCVRPPLAVPCTVML